jgi:hypothetical protein
MEEEMKREILKEVYPCFRQLMDESDEKVRRWWEEREKEKKKNNMDK